MTKWVLSKLLAAALWFVDHVPSRCAICGEWFTMKSRPECGDCPYCLRSLCSPECGLVHGRICPETPANKEDDLP